MVKNLDVFLYDQEHTAAANLYISDIKFKADEDWGMPLPKMFMFKTILTIHSVSKYIGL